MIRRLRSVTLALVVASFFAGLPGPAAIAVEPRLVPLHSWYSPGRQDNVVTSDPAWAGSAGQTRSPDYRFVRVAGMVFNPNLPQPADTVPLHSWYSPGRGDNFATTHPDWRGGPGAVRSPDYLYVRLEGYVFTRALGGTWPLEGWYSSGRGDNDTTSDPSWVHGPGNFSTTRDEYTYARREGYALPAQTAEALDPKLFGYDRARLRGRRPLLVILATFTDTSFTAGHTAAWYTGRFFGPGQPNIASYFTENSRGAFTFTNAGVVAATIPFASTASRTGEQKREAAIQAAADGGFPFGNFDQRSPWGRVTADELAITVIEAGDATIWGQNVGVSCVDGGNVDVCPGSVAGFGQATDLMTAAHELSHHLSPYADDIYGALSNSAGMTLMGGTLGNQPDVADTFHLDPFHKIQFGWVTPRVFPMTYTETCAELLPPQLHQVTGSSTRPVIVYDPYKPLIWDAALNARRPQEYFILEYRTSQTVPGAGVHDANSTGGTGLAVWFVRTTADGHPEHLRDAHVIQASDGRLDSTPSGDDWLDRRGNTDPSDDRIMPGGNGRLNSAVSPRDIRGDDAGVWTVGAPLGARGALGSWNSSNGTFGLLLDRNEQFGSPANGKDVSVVVSPQRGVSSLDVSFGSGYPGAEPKPRIDSWTPGSATASGSIYLSGVFGGSGGRVAKLKRGSSEYRLDIVSYNCRFAEVRIPSGVPAGTYDLVIDMPLLGTSNRVPFTVT